MCMAYVLRQSPLGTLGSHPVSEATLKRGAPRENLAALVVCVWHTDTPGKGLPLP